MTTILLSTVFFGILAGRYIMPLAIVPHLETYALWLLLAVLLGIGIELGTSSSLPKRLRKMQKRYLFIPLTSAAGTLAGSLVGAIILQMEIPTALSIGAGFGWYSLSSVILSDIVGAELAALAFITNVVREVMAIPLIPLLIRLRLGPIAITPGGATTMDTTLAIVSRISNEEITLVALYHGVVLSLAVPVLVAFFARLI